MLNIFHMHFFFVKYFFSPNNLGETITFHEKKLTLKNVKTLSQICWKVFRVVMIQYSYKLRLQSGNMDCKEYTLNFITRDRSMTMA
jgi:hypothetical protein